MSVWQGPPVCKLQGSMVIFESFTIRVTDKVGGAGEATSDFVLTEGDTWASLDDFLSDWSAQMVADFGPPFSVAVTTATGKIEFIGDGDPWSVAFVHAGDATEAARVRDWLGETGDIAMSGDEYTFTNAHKAGFYPSLSPSALARVSTSHRRGQGVTLATTSWTQSSPALGDLGVIALDLELQIDGRTDWAELWALAAFFDDVFDHMGEPFSVINVPTADASGDYWTGFVSSLPFEIVGERVEAAWDGLLRVAVRMEATHAPTLAG